MPTTPTRPSHLVLLVVALSSPLLLARPARADAKAEAERLANPDKEVRAAAAEALAKMGVHAKEALPAIETALGDRSQLVRYWAAVAVGGLGEKGASAAPALVPLTKDAVWNVRGAAVESLGHVRATGDESLAALLDAMADEETDVRVKAGDAFVRLGSAAVPYLEKTLASDAPLRAMAAAHALFLARPGDDAGAARLEAALESEDPRVAREAVLALTEMQRDGVRGAVVAAATRLLAADDWSVRLAAASAIGKIASVDAKVAAERGPADPTRRAALDAAVGPLGAALGDKNSAHAREAALGALVLLAADGRPMGPAAAPAVGALLDADGAVRARAAEVVSHLGADAKDVLPALLSALASTDAAVRVAVVTALGRSDLASAPGAGDVVTSLVDRLADDDPGVRRAALASLARLGSGAAPALPALLTALRSDDATLRQGAAEAIGAVGAPAKGAVDELLSALGDAEASVRAAAVRALGAIGRPPSRVARVLRKLEKDDPDAAVRAAAKEALAPRRRP